jgi:hypothetical protein
MRLRHRNNSMQIYKMCEPQNGFPYAPCWYDIPITTQGNFKYYKQFKNIIRQYQRYISFMDQKSIILSFLLTYVNTTPNNSQITIANYKPQTQSSVSNTINRTNVILYLKHNDRNSFIYLVYTKHSTHEHINSWN